MDASSHGRQGSRIGSFFVRRRKNINENLGLVVALLAAAFAGWSGYEAHKSRLETHEDTLLTLRLANRGYVVAENPEIVAQFSIKSGNVPVAVRPLAEGWQRSLLAKHLVKVYGNGTTPVFEVKVMADCQIGPIGELINKKGGIVESDIKTDPLTLPATMLTGSQFDLYEHCQNPHNADVGAVVYGAIHFNDVFGKSHFSHFCYYNAFLVVDAISDPDPKKWKESAINTGKHLIPCDNFNDSDLPVPNI